MFHGRFDLFSCDICTRRVYVKHLPRNWFWVGGGAAGAVQHCCRACAEQAIRDGRKLFRCGQKPGEPQVKLQDMATIPDGDGDSSDE